MPNTGWLSEGITGKTLLRYDLHLYKTDNTFGNLQRARKNRVYGP